MLYVSCRVVVLSYIIDCDHDVLKSVIILILIFELILVLELIFVWRRL